MKVHRNACFDTQDAQNNTHAGSMFAANDERLEGVNLTSSPSPLQEVFDASSKTQTPPQIGPIILKIEVEP